MINKNEPQADSILRQSVVDSLDGSIEHLDANTLSRLNQARHKALATREKNLWHKPSWLTAGTFAVLFVSLMTGWLMFSVPATQQMGADEFELVITNEDFELMQDLDFIAWMIEQEHAS
jgi:hypothetical protein